MKRNPIRCSHGVDALDNCQGCDVRQRKRDAAEEMYEALNECRELLLSGYTTREGKEYLGQDIQDAYVKIESAIAKANGRPA